MKPLIGPDVDFLAGRLHARRSRLADGRRLTELLQLADKTELERNVLPVAETMPNRSFQRQLVQQLIQEMEWCSSFLDPAGKNLIEWRLLRFETEDVKVLLRAVSNGVPLREVSSLLSSRLNMGTPDPELIEQGTDLAGLLTLLPERLPRRWLQAAVLEYPRDAGTFFREAFLDREFFRGLLQRSMEIPLDEREAVVPVVLQEIHFHQAMLILRGKFHYGLTGASLLPLLIETPGVALRAWRTMASDTSLLTAASRVVGKVWDTLPMPVGGIKGKDPSLSQLEALGWQRFLRLAIRSFRHSHMGSGAVLAYLGLRLVEVANLTTVWEALRLHLHGEEVTRRFRRYPGEE